VINVLNIIFADVEDQNKMRGFLYHLYKDVRCEPMVDGHVCDKNVCGAVEEIE
jgi:hypothetical protein